jgi:DNA-binding MarR family transcriptional regulator
MIDELDARLDRALTKKFIARQALLRRLLRETGAGVKGATGRGMPRAERLTPEQYAILVVLDSYGHGVTVKEVGEAIDLPFANVTRTLERLETKGLVYRTRGVEDRRQMIVKLTLEGAKTARRLGEVRRRLEQTLWGKYDEREKRLLINLLSR